MSDDKTSEGPSYHDVKVICGPNRLELWPSRNYALQLRCTKCGGWDLWYIFEGKEQSICGEYGHGPMRIEVDGMVILDTYARHYDESDLQDIAELRQPISLPGAGWDGTVVVKP